MIGGANGQSCKFKLQVTLFLNLDQKQNEVAFEQWGPVCSGRA